MEENDEQNRPEEKSSTNIEHDDARKDEASVSSSQISDDKPEEDDSGSSSEDSDGASICDAVRLAAPTRSIANAVGLSCIFISAQDKFCRIYP